ncbi:hypothetical protein BD311DRAFT_747147 [Dichomitus squalens]|uniref:Uncharacterized protein n=1 Tax=Dichomitus squalens TaxID=114155 RepID=A0A4Q9N5H9_9APHY|nr:hypothetical protein BD311DRAFT_747147 [Dichomitus squalens]
MLSGRGRVGPPGSIRRARPQLPPELVKARRSAIRAGIVHVSLAVSVLLSVSAPIAP